MAAPDTHEAFFHREGSYELCAALRTESRSRQELLGMIDVPERTIDRRLSEAANLDIITPVATTDTKRIVQFDDAAVSADTLSIIDSILSSHDWESEHEKASQPPHGRLHRSHLNESSCTETSPEVPNHANVSGGHSTFF